MSGNGDEKNKAPGFWTVLCAAGIRALHTMAQTALSTIGVTSVMLSDVNWRMVISSALLAGLISMLKSVAVGMPEVE